MAGEYHPVRQATGSIKIIWIPVRGRDDRKVMELKFKEYKINKIDTPKFIMSPVELKDYIDFEVRRVYFISKPTKDAGGHCHKEEKEFFIMVQGTCTAVIDRGNGLEEFKMESPTSALYIGSYIWHYFKEFSPNAILLALSSTNYNPDRSDYIENYEEFKGVVKK
jgi:mannose-6-phosphate isomerase-like protein (cupin superfamily)